MIALFFNKWRRKTAGVVGCKPNLDKIIIPSSIMQESKEYDVTCILENEFKESTIKIVQFGSDSKLHTIDKNAFSYSLIEIITVPSSVTIIDEYAFSWCEQLEVIELRIPLTPQNWAINIIIIPHNYLFST